MNEAPSAPSPDPAQVPPTVSLKSFRLNTTDDRATPVWDMSQERVFMETLMNQRFNFFLVFIGLILNAAVNSQDDTYFRGILVLGSVIALLLTWPIFRAHRKLDTIFLLLKKDVLHPLAFVDSQHKGGWSARWLLGWGIPGLAAFILVVLAVAAICGGIDRPGKRSQALASEHMAVLESRIAATSQELIRLQDQTRGIHSIGESTAALQRELDELRAMVTKPQSK